MNSTNVAKRARNSEPPAVSLPTQSTIGAQSASFFATTHWTMVLTAGGSQNPSADQALEELCRTYWSPLYAFARRAGNAPELAADLTQGFFAHFLQKQLLGRADPGMGRFRSFLLACFKSYVAHEHERATALKRGGGQSAIPFDQLAAERLYAAEPADQATPESIFERRWALSQIENALHQLSAAYAAGPRALLFELLKDYVWGDKNGLTLGEIAAQLDLTEEAVKKAVQRLRQQFRECLRREVAQTLSSPDQLEDELRHLRRAISPGG
jgi:RNA polymerase sigma factor (sigma-70 family)